MNLNDSQAKAYTPEQLKKQGLILIDQDTRTFGLDLAVIQELPAKEFLRADGAILNFLNDDKDCVEAYISLRDTLVNRINITLYYQKISDTVLDF